MNQIRYKNSMGIILLVAFLTVALSSFLLLVLSQIGLIAFTGGGWLVNCFNFIIRYLGYSTLFFIPTFLGFCIFFVLSKISLSTSHARDGVVISYYLGGVDIFIALFFAVGILFTAWGMQNALVSALGGLSEAEATQMGAWGILKRLVDNGILIALWTTIVGLVGGYLMRLLKFLFLDKDLKRYQNGFMEREKQVFLNAFEPLKTLVEIQNNTLQSIESMKMQLERLERNQAV